MIALLASAMGLVIGMVIGAATQRWGDADRATHGHKVYPTIWAARPIVRSTKVRRGSWYD